MACFFLIRHGQATETGIFLSGRKPGVHLSAAGQAQAQALPQRLAGVNLQHLVCSPMERTRETAQPLSDTSGLPIQISPLLIEVDFGDWTGRSLADLESDAAWREWNRFRSGLRIPGGEMMIEVQSRMLLQVEQLFRAHPDGNFALFSHGDPLKTILLHFLGAPLNEIERLELSPASISLLELHPGGARVLCINSTGSLVF